MRKVMMLNRVSLDGCFAGPNGEIDWFIHDSEVDKAAHESGGSAMLLSGRVTYQMFESYWPNVGKDPNAPEGARATAKELDQMTKVVFSTTLKEVTWKNSRLVNGDPAAEVRKLKQESGPTLLIFGSGTLIQQLTNAGLIDDYLMILTPVVLGAGKPLFKDVKKLDLELVSTQSFNSGNVLLHYKRADVK